MATQKAKTVSAEVNFGDMSMYTAGVMIAEGNYACTFTVQMEPETDNYKPKVPRIGVMLEAHSLTDPAEVRTKFLAWGKKAHEIFAPNPDTGKGVVLRAGVQGGGTIPSQSNWGVFLKSLYDSGLPIGIFTNDLSTIDGIHVHLANIPESDERKGMKNKKALTSEVEEEPKFDGPSTTLAVTEILEGGAPWEGGGGIPEVAAKPNGKPSGTNGKAGAVVTKTPIKAKAAPTAAAEVSEEDIMAAAINGVTAVLEKNPNGVGKMILKMGTFKAVTASDGDALAQAVQSFISDDAALGSVVEQLGYMVEGLKIVPAPA